jgi:hypothetical protein
MENQIEIYQVSDGQTRTEVKFVQDLLNQKQMAKFLGKDTDTIGLHSSYIFRDEEVEEWSTTGDFSGVHQ